MRGRFLVFLVAAAATAVLVGCSGQRGAAADSRLAKADPAAPDALQAAGLQRVWEMDLSGPAGYKKKITVDWVQVYPDTILAGSKDNLVFALDRQTGALKWITPVPARLLVAPTRFNGVFYSAAAGRILAIDEKGELSIGPEIHVSLAAPLIITEDYYFAVGTEGSVHKLSKDTLTGLWPAPARVDGVVLSQPVMIEGTIVFGTTAGELVGIDRITGGKRLLVTGFGGIMGGVAADEGRVYFGSNDYYAYSYTTLGSLKWKTIVSGQVTTTPTVAGKTVYFETLGGGLLALDKETGAIIWTGPDAVRLVATDCVTTLAQAAGRRLQVLNAADGAVQGSLDISDFQIVPRNTLGDGVAYLVSERGRVLAVKAK